MAEAITLLNEKTDMRGRVEFLVNSMAMYHRVIEEIRKDKPTNIVDIGCSIGYGSYILSKEMKDADVLGLDIEAEKIEEAIRIFQDHNLSFEKADITDTKRVSELLEKVGLFDVILCFEVFEHIPMEKSAALLNSMRKMLKPGGLVFISTPNREIYRIDAYTPGHVNEISLEELRILLRSSGFGIEKVWGVGKRSSISSTLLMRYGLVRRENDQKIELSKSKKILRKAIVIMFEMRALYEIVLNRISGKRYLDWKYNNAINDEPEWSHLVFIKALVSPSGERKEKINA